MAYVTWYAQNDGNWGDANLWLDGSNNSGMPDDYDTADAAGHTIGLGSGNLPDHIILATGSGGEFVANTSRSIGTGTTHCWMQGSLTISSIVRFEAFCLAYNMQITLSTGGHLDMLGGFYNTTLNRNGGTFDIYPDLTLTGSSGSIQVAGTVMSVGVVPAAGDVRYNVDVGTTTGTCRVPAAGDVEEGVAVDNTTGTFKVPSTGYVESGYKYGAGGTEFEGTAAGGGATAEDVAAAVWNYNANGQTAQARLESIPTVANAAAAVWNYNANGQTAQARLESIPTVAGIWAAGTRSLTAAVDVGSISGDTTAADNLEAMLDGTGGVNLNLSRVFLSCNVAGEGAIEIANSNSSGRGISISNGSNGFSIYARNSLFYGICAISGGLNASITGNLIGKVTGAGDGTIVGVGAWVAGSGGSVFPTPQEIWEYETRTITSTGLTAADVWGYESRSLTSGAIDAASVAEAVWEYEYTGNEALGTPGHSIQTFATDVWAVETRSLTTSPLTAAEVRQEIDANSTQWADLDDRLTSLEETVSVMSTATATAVWEAETRSLTTYGTLAADAGTAAATAVWAAATRSLTTYGSLVSDAGAAAATAVWAAGTRSLTTYGSLVSDTGAAAATAVWAAGTRSLTDKAGFAPSAVQVRQEMDSNSTVLAAISSAVSGLPAGVAAVQDSLDSIDLRIPASLSGGRMDAHVGAMAAGTISADTLSTGTITSAKLAAGAIDSAAIGATALAAIATALLDLANGVETGVTLRQALQRIGAVVAGKSSGAGTGVEVFTGLDGTTSRATINVGSDGNRVGATYS